MARLVSVARAPDSRAHELHHWECLVSENRTVVIRFVSPPEPAEDDRLAFQEAAVLGNWDIFNRFVKDGLFRDDPVVLSPDACVALKLRPDSTFAEAAKYLHVTAKVLDA